MKTRIIVENCLFSRAPHVRLHYYPQFKKGLFKWNYIEDPSGDKLYFQSLDEARDYLESNSQYPQYKYQPPKTYQDGEVVWQGSTITCK